MSEEEYDYEKEGRTKRRIIFGSIAVVLIGGIVSFFVFSDKTPSAAKPKEAKIIEVFIPPPTPPPPLPPPPPPQVEPPPPEEEQMVEQEPVSEEEPPPDDSPPEPPSPDIGTGLTGGDGNGFGLTSGGGNGNGRRGSIGGGSGSKYGWYASKVQSSISSALRGNSSTRNATFTITVKIWADRLGRVTRAELVGTTGQPDLDRTIRSQILTGLQLTDPPPADMPMPINLRMTARQP